MSDVSTWDALDANNTLPPPDGWPEFMQPSGVNNCGRMMMGAVRRMYDQQISGAIVLPYLKLVGGQTVTGAVTFSAGVTTTSLTASGSASVSGTLAVGSSINSGSSINALSYSLSGVNFAGRSSGFTYLYDATGQWVLQNSATTNYYANTAHSFGSRNNAATFATLDSAGLTLTAALSCTGISAASLTTSGAITATGAIVSNRADGLALYAPNGGVTVAGAVTGASVAASGTIRGGVLQSAGPIFAYDETNFGIAKDASNRYFGFKTGCSFYLEDATGNCNWALPGGIKWQFRGDGFCYAATNSAGGAGDYINVSDRRTKDPATIAPATAGLAEVLQLQPVRFQRLERADWEVGFIAQDVQDIIPEAVRAIGVELPDGTGGLGDPEPTLGLTSGAIVAALVNAIKTLDQRLTAGGL